MVRFSCFHTGTHYNKSKKEVQRAESMHETSQDCLQDLALMVSGVPNNLNPILLKARDENHSNTSAEQVASSSSVDHCWKSEEMSSNFSPEGNIEVHQSVCLKKSQSMGSKLNREGRVFCSIDTEDETGESISCDDSHEENNARISDALHHNGLVEPFDNKDPAMNLFDQYQEALVAESFQENGDPTHNEPILSIENPKKLEREGHDDFAIQLSGEHASDSGPNTPGTPSKISKSCSLPNMGMFSPTSGDNSPSHVYVGLPCRSDDDLDTLDAKSKEFLNHDLGPHITVDQERDDDIFESGKDKSENHFGDGYETYSSIGLVKGWTIPEMDKVDMVKSLQGESSVQRWDELPSKEFKIKRIKEWVSMIDLEAISPLLDTNESSHSTNKVGSNVLSSVTAAKLDAKTTPGIEAAKNYITSLTATSTSATLINLGLIVIPFLSAFVSLRMLNLSGNAIVRITVGSLPRGLHMLNLSKNKISTIEGLRELTCLRVLDLSYNRISRIGHGLASCTSLKELYLAGNKISEAEGLHRLLKLNILNLCFNKISTAKCLGQLAANYSSLQAISLEGNPAQRNVGDEQLKKYLQGLLPHLFYFNKQPIKTSCLKEVADRPARSAITAHQFDRGLRSEHKLTWKGTHNVATHKQSSSSSHGHIVQR